MGLVELKFTLEQAEEASDKLSDLLCWAEGFMAACHNETNRYPMGVEAVRELRIRLKSAIRKAQSGEK